MIKAIYEWLANVPIADPVDRRNAVAMQLLLLFVSAAIPSTWIYFITTVGMPRTGMVGVALAGVITLAAVASFAMIRRGRFRPAVVLFLSTLLVWLAINHLTSGFRLLMVSQHDQFLLLILGGLILGRRALWLIFAGLVAIVFAGCVVDYARYGAHAFDNLPSAVFGYLVVAIMLDRTVAALRQALDESDARRHELVDEMAARERAQAQLVHAQKLKATGQLASGVAHDFNNVLGVILGYATRRERLADRGGDALVDALAGVETETRRALDINRKLLDFSRHEILHLETFDVRDALTELQPMLERLFHAGTSVHLELPETPLPVRLDREQFLLTVLNIAANARDAMPEGGGFSVSARAVRAHGDADVELLLCDTGDGIPDALRHRVFEPFFTTKPAGDGTGLGLSLVYDIVKAADGDIAAEPNPDGRGTCFRIVLPRADDGANDA